MRKFSALILALCLLASLLCSCSKGSAKESRDRYEYISENEYSKDIYGEDSDGANPKYGKEPGKSLSDSSVTEQKLIKRYSVNLETTEYDKAKSEIASLIKSYGGYLSSSTEEGGKIYSDNTRSSRHGEFTARIPAAKLDEFISELSGKGNVISSSLSSDDITDSYYTYQSRLEALALQEERILAMMEKADSLDYLIKLEDKLSSIRSEINEINYKIKYYDKSVDYSYVNISLREVIEYTEAKENTFLSRLGNAAKNTFVVFANVLGEILIAFVWVAPFAIVGIIVAIVAMALTKRSRKKKESAGRSDTENKQ